MIRINTFLFYGIAASIAIAIAGLALAAAANVDQRPIKFGTTLPATCWTGDVFFNTNAPAGSNLFACTATNTWVTQTLQSLGGDVSGSPGSATVTQIQGRPVSASAPSSGQSLVWSSSTNTWQPQTISTGGSGPVTLGGDATGPSNSVSVVQIQGHPVSSATPQNGQTLVWNSSSNSWQPQAVTATSVTLSGDASGPSSSVSVVQIQGHPVSSANPQAGQTLTWNASTNRWEPQTPSGGAVTLAGDVTGASSAATVVQMQGRAIANVVPQNGQALVWNSATNRWEPQTLSTGGGGNGSGASMVTQLGDLAVTRTGNNTLVLGANCSFTTPCNIRFGYLVYSITSSTTVTLSSGTGNALFYISSAGTITVGHNLTLSCTGTCTAASGVTGFPVDSIPLNNWHATNGTWDATGSDVRAMLATRNITPGLGLLTSDSSGNTMVSADSSLVSLRASVPATSSSSCTAGTWAMDTNYYYMCIGTNTWKRAALSSW